MNREAVKARKRARIAEQKKLDAARRADQWEEIKCWWTWPLGHVYGSSGTCVGCGRYREINL